MNCDQARTEIIAYLKNELEDAPKKALEEHLARCPNCRQELEGARRLLSWTEAASQEAVAKKVEGIIDGAIAGAASDIHLEPQRDNELLVRYRIDGVMQEVERIDPTQRNGVVTRLKMLADLSVSETSVPQDGTINWTRADKEFYLRISSIPFVFGESLVLRILDRSSTMLGLDKLGFHEDDEQRLRDLLGQPNGIILVAGPTGSGKTTTMYSMLQAVNAPSKKIMTIEDPVEYVIPGVNHGHVNRKAGFTFASAIRSFMRHDPDVIMVGEVRDMEVALLSLQAALTGHLVIPALPTGDAPSALIRLVDMGAEPFMISAAVRGVLAQLLVRRVCRDCGEAYQVQASELRRFGFHPKDPDELITLYRGKGCETCRRTGYRGRTGIYELMTMNDEIADLLVRRAPLTDIREAAKANGMRELREDGLLKVLEGITTPDEVMRALA